MFGQRSKLNILGEVWPSAEFVGKNARRRRIVLESFTRSKIGESDSGLSKISIHVMTDLSFAFRQLLSLMNPVEALRLDPAADTAATTVQTIV